MVAPGTTAPDGSETTPATEPVDAVCAAAGTATIQSTAARASNHAAGSNTPPKLRRNGTTVVGRLITPPVGTLMHPSINAEIRSHFETSPPCKCRAAVCGRNDTQQRGIRPE